MSSLTAAPMLQLTRSLKVHSRERARPLDSELGRPVSSQVLRLALPRIRSRQPQALPKRSCTSLVSLRRGYR